jgi:AcrR family transcriptional regulator
MASDMPAVPWHKERRTDVRQPLDPDTIIDAGIRVLDREGLAGVTMRRVAQELDTGAASLYAHMANKNELLELMLERIAGEIRLPERSEPHRWKEQIKEVCLEAQRVYTSHRDVSAVSLGSIPLGENQLRIAEFLLRLMMAVGIPDAVAAWALDGLGQLVDSDAYEAALYSAKLKDEAGADAYTARVREYFSRLPRDRFPLISGMAEVMTDGSGNERFEFKIELFLRGLETYIER